MQKIFKTGFILFIVTMALFFGTYFFLFNENYFDISLKINLFALIPIYALAAIFLLVKTKKENAGIGFRESFRTAFLPMFTGSFLSFTAIYLFLNFADPEAKHVLNYQYVASNEKSLDEEYAKAKKILKNPEDIAALEENYRLRKTAFSPKMLAGKDMFTFSHFSSYFGGINLFYLILSVFLAGFFRTVKKI